MLSLRAFEFEIRRNRLFLGDIFAQGTGPFGYCFAAMSSPNALIVSEGGSRSPPPAEAKRER
jgi:hypothetical protein